MELLKLIINFIISLILEVGFLLYGYIYNIQQLLYVSYTVWIVHGISSFLMLLIASYKIGSEKKPITEYPDYVKNYKLKYELKLKWTDYLYNIIACLSLAYVEHYIWAAILMFIFCVQDEVCYNIVKTVKENTIERRKEYAE